MAVSNFGVFVIYVPVSSAFTAEMNYIFKTIYASLTDSVGFQY
jgi:hypothetical protein